jgi:hypothetical protein
VAAGNIVGHGGQRCAAAVKTCAEVQKLRIECSVHHSAIHVTKSDVCATGSLLLAASATAIEACDDFYRCFTCAGATRILCETVRTSLFVFTAVALATILPAASGTLEPSSICRVRPFALEPYFCAIRVTKSDVCATGSLLSAASATAKWTIDNSNVTSHAENVVDAQNNAKISQFSAT